MDERRSLIATAQAEGQAIPLADSVLRICSARSVHLKPVRLAWVIQLVVYGASFFLGAPGWLLPKCNVLFNFTLHGSVHDDESAHPD